MANSQITVVIPTLGIKNSNKSLKILNENKYIKKIIISIANNSFDKNNYKKFKKVQLIYSKVKGQVYQRISVHKYISTKYVLYMDDDIFFKESLIEDLLMTKIKKGNKSVIAPVYYNKKTKKKIHPLKGNLIFFIKKIIHFLLFNVPISEERMGKVSLAGSCYGVDGDYIQKNPIRTSWLPGGCFIISKKCMIKYNYFRTNGKAFCEDLILSFLLKKKKIDLYVEKRAKIFTDPPTKLTEIKDIIEYLNGHKIYCEYAKLDNLRVKIWRLIFHSRLILKKFFD